MLALTLQSTSCINFPKFVYKLNIKKRTCVGFTLAICKINLTSAEHILSATPFVWITLNRGPGELEGRVSE